MSKKAPDATLDTFLDKIATATQYLFVVGEPADGTEALADAVASATIDGGDFSKAAGDVSGRKITVAAQSDVSITDDGEADHIALLDSSDVLIYVTTISDPQPLTTGGTVSSSSFQVEIRQAA